METTPMTLFYTKTVRAYEPNDVPENLQERLCQQEAEFLGSYDWFDGVQDSLQHDMGELGVKVGTGRGEFLFEFGGGYGRCVGLTLDVTDPVAFARDVLLLDAEHVAIIKTCDDHESVSLRARPKGRHVATEAETVATNAAEYWIEFDSEEEKDTEAAKFEAAIAALDDAWQKWVGELETRIGKELEEQHDYLLSWEQIAERLTSMDELVTEEGDIVTRDACEKRTDADAEDSES